MSERIESNDMGRFSTVSRMTQITSRILMLLVTLGSAALAPFTKADTAPADVRIVIDISGSMKETDPSNLRSSGVNMLVEMLPEGSKAGVWTFGQYVNMLVKHADVDDAWKASARRATSGISSAGQRTNLTDALDRAVWEREGSANEPGGYRRSVILLTDGKIDMAPTASGDVANIASRRKLFETVLPRYQALNVPIHTLALSDAADKELLRQLALETGGLFLQPRTADELSRSFLKAFDQSAPSEQVPLEGNNFDIDKSVDEFTALVFRKAGGKPVELVAPSGKRHSFDSAGTTSGIRWHQDIYFDLITVKGPETGTWHVDADVDPDNRVQVLSDLNLKAEGIQPAIFSGDGLDLQVSLTNEGRTVSEQALLQLTDMTLKVVGPDGRTGSVLLSNPESVPADGLFSYQMDRMTTPGEYRFEVQASSPTFKRKKTLTSVLSEPFSVTGERNVDTQQFRILVATQSDVVDPSTSRVLLRIVTPDGSSLIHPLEYKAETAQWEYLATASQGPGNYEYQLNIRGVTTSGKAFRSQPEELRARFPLQGPGAQPVDDEGDQNEQIENTPVAAASPAAAEKPEPELNPPPQQKPAEVKEREMTVKGDEGTPERSLDDEKSGGFPWLWVMIGVGVLLLLSVAGGLFWWLRKRKKQSDQNENQEEPAPVAEPEPVATIDPEPEAEPEPVAQDIQEMDDFEAFMSEGEEKISGADEQDDANPDGAGLAPDENIDPLGNTLGPDDLESSSDDEDWGEFDEDTDDQDDDSEEDNKQG